MGSGLSWDEMGYRWGGDLRLGCFNLAYMGLCKMVVVSVEELDFGSGMRGFVFGKLGSFVM